MIKINVSAIMRKEKINVKSVIARANKAIIQPNIIVPCTMVANTVRNRTVMGYFNETPTMFQKT